MGILDLKLRYDIKKNKDDNTHKKRTKIVNKTEHT